MDGRVIQPGEQRLVCAHSRLIYRLNALLSPGYNYNVTCDLYIVIETHSHTLMIISKTKHSKTHRSECGPYFN